MNKKFFSLILAVCFVPLMLVVSAGCSKELSQEEIYAAYQSAIQNMSEYENSLTSEEQLIISGKDGNEQINSYSHNKTTFDAQNNISANKEVQSIVNNNKITSVNTSINHQIVQKTENNYIFYEYDEDNNHRGLIVASDYAKGVFLQENTIEFLTDLLFNEEYENILNNQIDQEPYLQDLIDPESCENFDFSFNYFLEDRTDSLFAEFNILINAEYEENYVNHQVSIACKSQVLFNETFIHSFNYSISTNHEVFSIELGSKLASNSYNVSFSQTLTPSFDSEFYGNFNTEGFVVPTIAEKANLVVFLDGEEVVNQEFACTNNLHTILSTIQLAANTTYKAYYDEACTQEIPQDVFMSSYYETVVYMKTMPNENYAWVLVSYHYNNGDLIKELEPAVIHIGGNYVFSTNCITTGSELTFIQCNQKILVNETEVSQASILLQSQTRYVVKCFSAINANDMCDVVINVGFLGVNESPVIINSNVGRGTNVNEIVAYLQVNRFSNYVVEHVYLTDEQQQNYSVNNSSVISSNTEKISIYLTAK